MTIKNEHRIFPFLWMRGEAEAVLREEMQKIHESGITGVCVESRPHPDFLGPGWWKDMDVVLEEAERLDMQVWILDDAHFPTGYANGAVKEHPELAKIYLACSFSDAVGPAPGAELDCGALLSKEFTWRDIGRPVRPPLMEETTLISVTARKFAGDNALSGEHLDLTGQVGEDGILRFDLPAGQWRICVVYTTRADGGDPEYLNPLEREAVDLLIQTVYEPHFSRYGTRIAGFFSDEPCLGNLNGFGHDAAVGRKLMNLPWSKDMPRRLKETLGVRWRELLPLLWADCADRRVAAKVRLHYMDAVTGLYGENFTGHLGRWCAKRGLEYIGHVVEDNGVHTRLGCGAGHYFRAVSGQHMAGIDVIGGQITRGGGSQIRYGFGDSHGCFFHHALVPMGASAAMLDPGKKGRLMCELFGAYGWTYGVREMKWLTDFLISHGVNRLVPHAFSMKEYPDPDCPPHFYARGRNAQFKHFGDLMRYADELCGLFSGGVGGARTAILYPAECDWMGECMPVEAPARELELFQVDFWILPEDALSGRKLPSGTEPELVIVPETEFLTRRMAETLAAREPGSYLFVNRMPRFIPDADPAEERNLLMLMSSGAVCPLDELGPWCRSMELQAGTPDPYFADLHIYRYRKERKLLYFLFNQSAAETFDGAVKLSDGSEIRLTLHPYESALVCGGKILRGPLPETPAGAERWDLSKGWTCSLLREDGWEKPGPMEPLVPVSDKEPRFSGRMAYERTVELDRTPAHGVLEVEWLFETADVYVDGSPAATCLTPPYRFDLSGALHEGLNRLRVEVAAPPARDALTYDMGPFGPKRAVIEPTGMFGAVKLDLY